MASRRRRRAARVRERPRADGVYLVASGASNIGMELIDSLGGQATLSYPGASVSIYDPFVRVVLEA